MTKEPTGPTGPTGPLAQWTGGGATHWLEGPEGKRGRSKGFPSMTEIAACVTRVVVQPRLGGPTGRVWVWRLDFSGKLSRGG